MKYLLLEDRAKEELLTHLADMPRALEAWFGGLSTPAQTTPGPDGAFSPVEQCWHLADLERDGFAVRIRRLLSEASPRLDDFDGAKVARDRQYLSRSLKEGLEAFRRARLENLRSFEQVPADAWTRAGAQEGVGTVRLCDIPTMMWEHDAAHRREIETWWQTRTI